MRVSSIVSETTEAAQTSYRRSYRRPKNNSVNTYGSGAGCRKVRHPFVLLMVPAPFLLPPPFDRGGVGWEIYTPLFSPAGMWHPHPGPVRGIWIPHPAGCGFHNPFPPVRLPRKSPQSSPVRGMWNPHPGMWISPPTGCEFNTPSQSPVRGLWIPKSNPSAGRVSHRQFPPSKTNQYMSFPKNAGLEIDNPRDLLCSETVVYSMKPTTPNRVRKPFVLKCCRDLQTGAPGSFDYKSI